MGDSVQTRLSKPDSFEPGLLFDTKPDSPITEFALPLLSFKGNQWFACGTATIIGSHLAITARHNLEAHWEHWSDSKFVRREEQTAPFGTVALQVVGNLRAIWKIGAWWPSKITDVTFLSLLPNNADAIEYGRRWRIPCIDLVPPEKGTSISAFGYRGSRVINDNDLDVVIDHAPSTAHGTVEEVHRVSRDSSRLSFPCFRTNARFDGGMSGGPVINNLTQRLCGIVCSSLPPSAPEEPHASYVTLLWTAMECQINMGDDVVSKVPYYPVLDLAKRGIIDAPDWSRIRLVRDITNNQTRVSLVK